MRRRDEHLLYVPEPGGKIDAHDAWPDGPVVDSAGRTLRRPPPGTMVEIGALPDPELLASLRDQDDA